MILKMERNSFKIRLIVITTILLGGLCQAQGQKTSNELLLEESNLELDSTHSQRAIELLTTIIQSGDYSFEGYFRRAKRRYLADDWSEARDDVTAAMKLDPKCAACHHLLGRIEVKLNKFTLARMSFLKALEIDISDIDTVIGYSTLYVFHLSVVNDYDMSYWYETDGNMSEELIEVRSLILDSIWEVLTEKYKTADYYRGRASRKLWNDNYEGAIKDWKEAVELYEYYPTDIYKKLAETYHYKLSDYFEASQYYNLAIAHRHKNYQSADVKKHDRIDALFLGRGQCKSALGDKRGALVDFESALLNYRSQTIKKDKILLASASVLLDLERYDEAVLKCQEAIDFIANPGFKSWDNKEWVVSTKGNGYAYYLRAWAHYMNKEIEKACLDWSASGTHGYKKAYDEITSYCK